MKFFKQSRDFFTVVCEVNQNQEINCLTIFWLVYAFLHHWYLKND